MSKCTVPPPGWKCTREGGHTGPCAAVMNETTTYIANYGVSIFDGNMNKIGEKQFKTEAEMWAFVKEMEKKQ